MMMMTTMIHPSVSTFQASFNIHWKCTLSDLNSHQPPSIFPIMCRFDNCKFAKQQCFRNPITYLCRYMMKHNAYNINNVARVYTIRVI